MPPRTPQGHFEEVARFIGLTDADLELVGGSRTLMAALLPAITQRISDHLLGNAHIRRHFEHDGPADRGVVGRHLSSYVEGLIQVATSEQLAEWMARVGPMHTPARGDPRVHVPRMQIEDMLDFLIGEITSSIWSADMSPEQKTAVSRAFTKALWVQRAMFDATPSYQQQRLRRRRAASV